MRVTRAYINRKTRGREKKRKEGQGIGESGGEGDRKIWSGEERKKGAKKGERRGREEQWKRKGRREQEKGERGKREGRTHTRKHKDTQMNTDEDR